MTQYRWVICAMLFFATTVNYLDRQVLSLTWDEFIKPEFHWNEYHYGLITSIFSIVYAVCMLFAGRFIDWMGTKKGYLWAIGVWSLGACLHALCGVATEAWVGLPNAAALRAVEAGSAVAATIAMVSMYFFIAARCILALGEAGNFPAAIKVTAEYFPKKDRAYATSIFNAGASIGALFAPLTIPLLAKAWGWEMAFIVIGALGFVWMGFWVFMYKKPSEHPRVNAAELEYIEQDKHEVIDGAVAKEETEDECPKMSFWKTLSFKQTWAFAFGKFMTDGVWWFFLFWTPSYLNSQFGIKMSEGLGVALIFTLYAITMLSIYGGKLPTIIINKTGLNPYAARMRAMLIFAFFPLLVLLAQPLGHHFAVVPDHPDRYRRRGAPVVVGQYLLDRGRHVPQVGDRHRDGYRRHGRRCRLDDPAMVRRMAVRACRGDQYDLHGLRGKTRRIFRRLLHLRRGLPRRLDRDEDAGSEIQAYRIGLI